MTIQSTPTRHPADLPVRLILHGVRGSVPSPGPDTARHGGNTPCVELRHRDGRRLILDAGTGIRRVDVGTEPLHIVLTHYHWDHVQGLPHLPALFDPEARIVLAGPRDDDGGTTELDGLLDRLFRPAHFPVPARALAARIEVQPLDEGVQEVGGWTLDALRVRHPSVTYGYRIDTDVGAITYVPDHELTGGSYPGDHPGRRDEFKAFIKKSRILIHDGMYAPEELKNRAGWGHSSGEDVVQLARESGAEDLLLFHHAATATDADLTRRLAEIHRADHASDSTIDPASGRPADLRIQMARECEVDLGGVAGDAGTGAAAISDPSNTIRDQLQALTDVARALTAERDPARLLERILDHAMSLAGADAGSLYLRSDIAQGPGKAARPSSQSRTADEAEDLEAINTLSFRLARNRSLPDMELPVFELPMNLESIAGAAAVTAEPVVLDDVYDIPPSAPYTFNPAFDEAHGYRARSMLAVPMTNRDGQVVGVLQLINRLRVPGTRLDGPADTARHVTSFSPDDVSLARALAGQAAVSIENTWLTRSIEALFEGFARAMVTAIDQRDPATSGHSVRVATLTCDLARFISDSSDPPFEDVAFDEVELQELRYAGLLHDVGKVGVAEAILLKSGKLPEATRARVDGRLAVLAARLETRRLEDALDARGAGDAHWDAMSARVEEVRELVQRADRPRPLSASDLEALQELARGRDALILDTVLLEPAELALLQIPRGTLSEVEREEVEAHSLHSWRFLSEIPWPRELAAIPDLALNHHEKLDGSGYPRGVDAAALPLPTRILTVADIFDALTAMDRAYRDALAPERALAILREEAEAGQLDPGVVEALAQSRAYERILTTDWHDL